jgi:hypothetical protein
VNLFGLAFDSGCAGVTDGPSLALAEVLLALPLNDLERVERVGRLLRVVVVVIVV